MRVCLLDSGVEDGHPRVGPVTRAVAITVGEDDEPIATEDLEGDLCGHGTACASVVHALAPEAEIHSVRVLGAGFSGSGRALIAGLRWAVDEGYDVINMSLSTTKPKFAEALHELADRAYFKRTVVVASAHNMPVESLPVALLVRDLGRRATTKPIRSSSMRTRSRRSSSSRTASTSRSAGSAAARSARPATASPPRASPGSPH